jgi:hypothetical protein
MDRVVVAPHDQSEEPQSTAQEAVDPARARDEPLEGAPPADHGRSPRGLQDGL